ncbi:MAG: hypothetical protein VB104_07810 [Candidatus Limiplasma sp.]|nr:hypothetical protein [Candidatus Limiplasma sp.]
MRYDEFIARLPHEPTKRSGETMCKCPAHADRKCSLSVKDGERGIVLHCFAGCRNEDILEAMGLKMADLFREEEKGGAARPAARKGRPAAQQDGRSVEERTHTVQAPAPATGTEIAGDPIARYAYTDADGKPIFEVFKFRTQNGDKTFRQGVELRKPKPGPFDWKAYSWKTSQLPHPLYRLPEVAAAVAAGKPVYVAEGEKDVETLRALGLVATTNPGGASASQDARTLKWLPEHTEALRGADVVILRDEDVAGKVPASSYVGQKHAIHIARQLLPVAKAVRVLDLTQSGYAIPPKGDVTDLCELCGAEKLPGILAALVAATPPVTEQSLAAMEARYLPPPDPMETVAKAYAAVRGYCVEDGMICKLTAARDGDGEPYPKPLCTFSCLPCEEITQDDGVSTTTVHVIDGWDRNGAPMLPQARVSSKNYKSMNWVSETWGFRANILPGQAVVDTLRYVIAEVGAANAKHVTEYTHSGWRRIGERWAYLYQGGAIGAEGVRVELGDGLDEYRLPASPDMAVRDAAEWSHNLTLTLAEHVSYPLLAAAYLAPLREALSQTGNKPLFSLFVVGEQQSGKSVSAELAQYHFRGMSEVQFPASFYDTSNHVQSKAFKLKDSLLVVDDFHPTTSIQERRTMDAMAQRLCRMKPRGRMNADGTSRVEMPPRCLSIMTGEQEPAITESGVSRLYVIEVEPKDVPKDEGLTAMQEQGKRGTLQAAMRGYIEWLTPQMEELPEKLAARIKQLRPEAQKMLGESGPRMSETVTYLLLGYEMMLKYMQSVGAVEYIEDEMQHARAVIIANGRRQTRQSRDERPSRQFLDTISDLLIGRVAEVRDLTDPNRQANPVKGMIGYSDQRFYYLMPALAYAMVCEQSRKAGLEFPLTQKALWKQMAVDNYLMPSADGTTNTRVKLIDKKSQRLLWIPRHLLDGGSGDEQTRLIVETEGGGADLAEIAEDEPF